MQYIKEDIVCYTLAVRTSLNRVCYCVSADLFWPSFKPLVPKPLVPRPLSFHTPSKLKAHSITLLGVSPMYPSWTLVQQRYR
jgi:hypothetical protein